jgi:hypothetical protein
VQVLAGYVGVAFLSNAVNLVSLVTRSARNVVEFCLTLVTHRGYFTLPVLCLKLLSYYPWFIQILYHT